MSGLSINSQTGLISYVPGSNVLGNYVIGISCKEYDRLTGTLLSESIKEMIITTINNPGTVFSNTAALSNGVTSVVNGTNTIGNTVLGCAGNNIDINLSFTHPTLSVSLWSPLNYEIPGATFTVTEGLTSTMHVNIPNTTPAGIYRFFVQAIDNNCYFATMSYDTFTLEIAAPIQVSNDITICQGDSTPLTATGDISYLWTPVTGLSCTTCANPMASPNSTTSYIVTGASTNVCGNTDTVKVTVDSIRTYYGVVSQANGTVYPNTNVFLITYNPVDSTVTAIDSMLTNTLGEYSFQSIEPMVWLKIAPDSVSYPNEIPTYYDSSALFLAGDSLLANSCDLVITNFSTLLGANPGGSGFIAGNVYQGAGKMDGVGDPAENVNLLLVNDQDKFVQYWITDNQGKLQFSNIPYGTYRIFVDAPKVDNSLAPSIKVDKNSIGITYNFKLNSTQLTRTSPNSVSEITDNAIIIYPNPASEKITIQSTEPYSCEIMDLNGRVLHTKLITSSSSKEIQVKEFPKGIYIIKLTSDNKTVIKRFVKN